MHHAHHVEGYRRVHRVAQAHQDGAHDGAAGTEEMREAMVEARALFEELVRPSRHDGGHRGAAGRPHGRPRRPPRRSPHPVAAAPPPGEGELIVMPEAPRHTQDTWIPNGPAGHGHPAGRSRLRGPRPRDGHARPQDGGRPQDRDLPSRGGTDAAHGPGSGPGTGSARTESPLVAAHPRTGDDTGAAPHGTDTHGTGDHAATSGTSAHHGRPGAESRLLADDTCDRLSAQLRQAVAGFVDRPRDAVEEADLVLREITERLTDALTERRRGLARNWKTPASGDPGKGDTAPAADTEQLRLALRDYRELAERLLSV